MTMILPGGQPESRQHLDEFQRADLNKAKANWDHMSLHQLVGNTGMHRPLPINFNRRELGKYSTGFQLYFKFIQSLSAFFSLAIAPAAYLIYLNYSGKGYTQSHSPYDTITLGNQPQYETATDEMQSTLHTYMYIDLGIISAFLLFYFWYRYSSLKEKEEIDQMNCNVSDYAIEVNGIPAKGVSEIEVATHFGMIFGSVNQCKFARNYQGTMLYFSDIADLQDEKRRQEAKVQIGVSKSRKAEALERRIQRTRAYVSRKLSSTFGEKIKTHSDFPAVKGFVLFDTMAAQNKCLRAYGKHQSVSFYKMIFCCQGRRLPTKLKLLGKYPIRVTQADEPTNIKWENQDTGPFEAFFRFLVVSGVVIACLVFTFGFIIASNVLSYSAEIGASCVGGTSTGSSIFTASPTNCICATYTLTDLIEHHAVACSDYIKARSIQYAMTIMSGVCIAFINIVIKQIYIALGKFQRYETLSKESGSTIVKYFLSLFINTAIIPILANSNIYGFEISKKLIEVFVSDSSKYVDNVFPSDFDQSWYSFVGAKIMSPMIIAAFSPHLIQVLFLIPCTRCMRKKNAKKAIFQKDLNKLYTPPEFKIAFNYGIALNILFVSLLYSAGMPLLWITAFASYTIINFSEKYIVARNCKKPPGYDAAQNQVMISAIPYAILLHCVVAIWMFGCPTIFPWDLSNMTWSNNIDTTSSGAINRIQRSFGHAIVGAIVLIFIIFDAFIWPIFLAMSNRVDQHSQNRIEQKRFGTFRQEYRTLSQLGIASYNLKVNPNYHDIIEAMQLDIDDDHDDRDEGDHKPVLQPGGRTVNNSYETSRIHPAKVGVSMSPSPNFLMQAPRTNQIVPMR